MTVWNFALWLHLLGMAFFLGGQLMLGAVVVPTLRNDREAMRAAAQRFGIGSMVAAVVLVGSGVAMASHEHQWSDSTLQVKLGLAVLVGVLVIAHIRVPRSPFLDAAIFLLTLAIVWLGIVVAG
jgi:putative copper export protein